MSAYDRTLTRLRPAAGDLASRMLDAFTREIRAGLPAQVRADLASPTSTLGLLLDGAHEIIRLRAELANLKQRKDNAS